MTSNRSTQLVAHTVGGRVNMWAQSSLTESYRAIRDAEGRFRDIVEPPPALILGVNMGSPVPREGKNSIEQQGAGDGCQTDRQTTVRWSHSTGWLTLF